MNKGFRWFGAMLAAGCLMVAPVRAMAAERLVVMGDSLSAGYGVPAGQGWVDLLANRLKAQAPDVTVINASISGDTTAGGLARIDGLLDHHRPTLLILELGANDGLRGLDLNVMAANLDRIIQRARADGVEVLLVGMLMPPNYGQAYTLRFIRTYKELAARHELVLVPFLLEGVADRPGLMQDDDLHPNEAAQATLLETVWRYLAPMLNG